MNDNISAPWIFAIDTEDYAGNFERELCAYLTGRTGDCEVGDDLAKLFSQETGLEPFENVTQEADEHGCYRPVTIYPTPGWFGNGLGGSFKDGQEEKSLTHYKKAAAEIYGGYAKAPRGHLEVLAGNDKEAKAELKRLGWTVKTCEKAIAEYEKRIAEAQALTKTPKYPGAYNSVAILFDTKPTKSQITLMKERAAKFAELPEDDYGQKPLKRRISKITGFRLIEQKVSRTTSEISA